MPEIWDLKTEEEISLQELIAHLDSKGKDPLEENLGQTAEMLSKLNNNKTFLCRQLEKQIKSGYFEKINAYTSQVFVLHATKNYVIRAVIWSPQGAGGDEVYFYEEPHCHNFKLLTLGYYGEGYRTRFYEYDQKDIYKKESNDIETKYLMDTQLTSGRVIYFYDSKDIHEQFPPDGFSISINILSTKGTQKPQFGFTIDEGGGGTAVKKEYSTSFAKNMLGIASAILESDEEELLLNEVISQANDKRDYYSLFKSLESDYIEKLKENIAVNQDFNHFIKEFKNDRTDYL